MNGMHVRKTASWPPPCPSFAAVALNHSRWSLSEFRDMNSMHGFFPLLLHFLSPRFLYSVMASLLIPLPSVVVSPLYCLGILVVSLELSSTKAYQLFFRLSCCPFCSLYHLSGCPACSVISPGVFTGLLSVLVSCPSICPGVLLVYHVSWCPLCYRYQLSRCSLCSITRPGIPNLSGLLPWHSQCSLCCLPGVLPVTSITYRRVSSVYNICPGVFCCLYRIMIGVCRTWTANKQ